MAAADLQGLLLQRGFPKGLRVSTYTWDLGLALCGGQPAGRSGGDVGALIIGTGFGGILYYNY